MLPCTRNGARNCMTAHQRPILASAVPDQKKPNKEYERLQAAHAHIFVNCSQGHYSSSHRLPAACCYLQPAAPDARSAVFWRDPRKPCFCLALPSLLQQLGVARAAASVYSLSALNLNRPTNIPPGPNSFSAQFSHISEK